MFTFPTAILHTRCARFGARPIAGMVRADLSACLHTLPRTNMASFTIFTTLVLTVDILFAPMLYMRCSADIHARGSSVVVQGLAVVAESRVQHVMTTLQVA